MRKILGSILIIVFMMLSGCSGTAVNEDIKYSENILLSINNGAPGYGTIEDCIDAEIFIYTDRTVRVVVYYPEEREIASLVLDESDFEALQKIAVPEKISKLKVENDEDGCDGGSDHIALYGENDEQVCYKGGYMPVGKKFWEVYNDIKDILEPYGIHDIVEEYRESVRNGNVYDASMTEAEKEKLVEYEEIAVLLEGEWICESQSAYIKIYPSDENSWRYKIDILADSQVHPITYNLYGNPLFQLEYGNTQGYILQEEDIAGESEELITFTANMGEMDFGGVLIADKGGEYIRYQLAEDETKWYNFFPYQEETPIDRYITLGTMGQMIKEMTGIAEIEEETARQIALKLMDLGVVYLYPEHYSIELTKQVYTVEALANCLEFQEGRYQYSDQTAVFYIDTQGNPLYENIWRIMETE